MKIKFLILYLFISVSSYAQNGIQFSHIAWNEAKTKAIQEKKLIFIDFYTQWCGPCLMMQKDVFSLNDVGNYFNATFINLKIDAEHGEGIELAKKYHVKVFPTYCFIDPTNENLVHESTSRQDKEVFLMTAKNALDPVKNSVYLLAQEKTGNNTPEFLINYANYKASMYKRDEASKAIEKLIVIPGYSLENKSVWMLFVNNITDRNHPLFKEFISSMDKYEKLYGRVAIDNKLFNTFQYCQDFDAFSAIPNFKGKDFLIKKNKAEQLIHENKYEEAAVIITDLMANPGEFKQDVCSYLYFTSNYALTSRASNKAVLTDFWKKKCISYIQYAAYNMPNREDLQLAYTYAQILENLLKSIPETAKYLPEDFASPSYGTKEYSVRSAELLPKPVKK